MSPQQNFKKMIEVHILGKTDFLEYKDLLVSFRNERIHHDNKSYRSRSPYHSLVRIVDILEVLWYESKNKLQKDY